MTALSTAEAALRRAPDDPGVPVTVSGTEAVALVAELDQLRERGDELAEALVRFMYRPAGLPRTPLLDRASAAHQAWRAVR